MGFLSRCRPRDCIYSCDDHVSYPEVEDGFSFSCLYFIPGVGVHRSDDDRNLWLAICVLIPLGVGGRMGGPEADYDPVLCHCGCAQ